MDVSKDTTHNARRLLLDADLLQAEVALVDRLLAAETAAPRSDGAPSPGVSVIVPSHLGVDRIASTLESLAGQTLDAALFEVIVILNGPDDGTEQVLDSFARSHHEMDLRVLRRVAASAGGARNLGLQAVKRAYVTFVDDDDHVESRFLEVGLAHAAFDHVVLLPIHDQRTTGEIDRDTTLAIRIRGAQGAAPLASLPWALGFNACKFVPIELARRASYREDLPSGEDLVYFSHLLEVPGLAVMVPSDVDDAAYLRALRDESVSRRELTEDFAVRQRIQCISDLEELDVAHDQAAEAARTSLIRAQAGFVSRYLDENPDQWDRVADLIDTANLRQFPWDMVNNAPSRHLAISYCFAPFSDTSAVVAAKAIAERRMVVDVITNDMSSARRLDPAVSALARRWISSMTTLKTPTSFAGWHPISEFVRQAVAHAETKHALVGGYETMYSRALWSASHAAAAVFKLRHWQVRWTAEFSDPMRTGADGSPRSGDWTPNDVSERLLGGLAARGFSDLEFESSFALIEAATIVLADELIFTNENQLEYMAGLWQSPQLTTLMRGKAAIRQHPVPSPHAYNVIQSTYSLPGDVVNIAYFGSFYPNRGIDELLVGLVNVPAHVRRALRVHVFCNQPAEVQEHVSAMGLAANVYVNPYLSYMEFLNASTKFDVLLVNDVQRTEKQHINPFLPSKLSDYRGSGARIWGLVDEGSPLSREPLDLRTPIGDAAAVRNTLIGLATERLSDSVPSSAPDDRAEESPEVALTW